MTPNYYTFEEIDKYFFATYFCYLDFILTHISTFICLFEILNILKCHSATNIH